MLIADASHSSWESRETTAGRSYSLQHLSPHRASSVNRLSEHCLHAGPSPEGALQTLAGKESGLRKQSGNSLWEGGD